MALNTQFSIAIHVLAALGFSPSADMTSNQLSGSVNASPSFVRRVIAKLSRAKLVSTSMGVNGTTRLARDPKSISLLEIYQAVDAPKAFAIHDYDVQTKCTVSRGIKSSLDKVLGRTQSTLEKSLAEMTLADVVNDLSK